MEAPTASPAQGGPADEAGLSLNRIAASLVLILLACVVAINQPPHPRPQAERSPVEHFLYPMESNPGLRLPSLPASLHAIRFADDGTTGWAAGAGGTILRTKDGGKTWNVRPTGTAATLYALQFNADGQRGWAVGDRGAILRTVDGGETWRLQRAPYQTRLTHITFNDEGTVGWISGKDGVLLKSADGGENWIPQSVPSRGFGKSIAIDWENGRGLILTRASPFDKLTAAITELNRLGASGVAFRAALSAAETLTVVAREGSSGTGVVERSPATAARSGVIGTGAEGGSGTELGTGGRGTDLGTGADQVEVRAGAGGGNPGTGGVGSGNPGSQTGSDRAEARPGAGVGEAFRELHFDPGADRFWAFGSNGALAASNDFGATWQGRNIDRGVDIEDVRFAEGGKLGWAVGSGGAIYATGDGGATWVRRDSGSSADFAAVYSSRKGERVWAAGEDGTLVTSNDGGDTWMALSSGAETVVNGVDVASDGRRAVAVGSDGLILTSDNGGATWQRRDSGTRQPLRAVSFDRSGNAGFAVGDSGTILASTDGGRTWQARESGAATRFSDVWTGTGGREAMLAAGTSGLLLTRDGGLTWNLVDEFADRDVRKIRFYESGRDGLAMTTSDVWITEDGGRSWAMLMDALSSIEQLADGDVVRGGVRIFVGRGGLIYGAGATHSSGTDADLLSVDLIGRGPIAWAAGEGGTLLVSRDAGGSWNAVDSGIGSSRRAIRFSENGGIGITVGHSPALLRTTDGGQTWSPIAWPLRYRRYPAPWFWLALLAACAPLALAARRKQADDPDGAAAIAASDKPTEDFARDKLQFGPLAMGISRFLRNSRTEPPLTLAISGNWGSGKSSLMQLVCTDLRRYGYRPVWFNAWHHQSDEQLLASLLNAVREQGLPSLASIDGWVFRFQLLWLRSKKNYVLALVAIGIGAAAAATWFSGDADTGAWTRIAETIRDLFGEGKSAKTADVKDAAAPASLLGLSVALFAAYRAMRAFGLDPAVLLSSSFNSFRLKHASAQTSFRDRFAEEFQDVTEALPYRMVIVIDDLDRCRPETVLTVMESVNFLVSAGPCFVLFGMARERVLAGLSLTFHNIAKELTDLDVNLPADATDLERERKEREARALYANDYLEKLINIDIKVPARDDIPPQVLLETETQTRRSGGTTLLKHLWPALLILAAAGVGVAVPLWLADSGPAVEKEQPQAGLAPPPRPEPSRPAAAVSEPAAPEADASPAMPIRAPLTTAQVQSGEESATWWYLIPALAIFGLILAAVLRYRLRRDEREVKDSKAFHQALQTWLPVVQKKRASPRGIKRFGNFIRYLAMLQQDDPTADPPLMPWLRRLALGRPSQGPEQPAAAPSHPKRAVEEHRLVALGALYDAYGSRWREKLEGEGEQPVDAAVREAIRQVKTHWPPSQEEIDSFEEAIKGIRFAGAAEIVRAGRHIRQSNIPPAGADRAERDEAVRDFQEAGHGPPASQQTSAPPAQQGGRSPPPRRRAAPAKTKA